MTITNEQGNKNTKRIWIGLGAAALFFLCSVAVAVLVFYEIGERVPNRTATNPEIVSKVAHDIAEYQLPQGYREHMAIEFKSYSLVMFEPFTFTTYGNPVMALAQFSSTTTDQQNMEDQIRTSFEQQAGMSGIDMQQVNVKKTTLRNEEVEVITYEGVDEKGKNIRQLIASFPGKDGTAMLMIMGDIEFWDQYIVDRFMSSIR